MEVIDYDAEPDSAQSQCYKKDILQALGITLKDPGRSIGWQL